MNKKKILSVFAAFLLLTFICSSSLNTKVFANGKKPNISYSEKKSNPLPEDMPNMFVGYMKKMQNTIKANWAIIKLPNLQITKNWIKLQ